MNSKGSHSARDAGLFLCAEKTFNYSWIYIDSLADDVYDWNGDMR